MALEAIYGESWAKDIEKKVHADDESKRRAEAGYAAAELEHERLGWRHACRTGADGDVTGEYDDAEELPHKRQRLPGQVGVLMVCQTNLARSPAAGAVFYQKAEAVGTGDQFYVDSCGLGGGNPVRLLRIHSTPCVCVRARAPAGPPAETPLRSTSGGVYRAVCLAQVILTPCACVKRPFYVQRWYEDGGFSYHEGEGRQDAMTKAAASRNLIVEGVSRPFTREDIMNYDYVVAMDEGNHNELHVACRAWGDTFAGACETSSPSFLRRGVWHR